MLTLHELFQLFVQGRNDARVWWDSGDPAIAFQAASQALQARNEAWRLFGYPPVMF